MFDGSVPARSRQPFFWIRPSGKNLPMDLLIATSNGGKIIVVERS
jgi:hypothetical protein